MTEAKLTELAVVVYGWREKALAQGPGLVCVLAHVGGMHSARPVAPVRGGSIPSGGALLRN